MGLSPFFRQSLVTAAVCMNVLGNGCIIGFPAVALPQLSGPGARVQLGLDGASWIGSTVTVTVLVGNFLTPSLMDRLGRRPAQLASVLPALGGWFAIAAADSFTALVIGRLLHGISFGMLLPLRSIVIGEYTSPRFRGAFLVMVSLSQAAGIFAVHLLGSVLDWQLTALIATFIHFVSFLMTMYAPESPSYLAARGRFQECRTVFRWLRGDEEEKELEDMIAAHSIVAKNSRGYGFLEVLKKKEFYKPVLIMINANMMMQFAGGTTMSAYATLIIGLIVGPDTNVNFWMVFLDAQRLVSNVFAIYIINKFNRRTMLMSIGGLSVASHVAIAAYVYARNQGLIEGSTWIPIVLLNIFYFTVATGMVPLPAVIAGEIFPFQYRGLGGSIAIVAWSLASFLVLKTFPALANLIGIEGIYGVYAVALTFFLTVILWLLPETKGRTLQQIEEEFRGRPLEPKEIEAKLSLQGDTRKMSIISMHSVTAEI